MPSSKLPDVVVVNGYADAATEWELTAAKRVLIGHVRYGILVKQYTNRDPDYRRGPCGRGRAESGAYLPRHSLVGREGCEPSGTWGGGAC